MQWNHQSCRATRHFCRYHARHLARRHCISLPARPAACPPSRPLPPPLPPLALARALPLSNQSNDCCTLLHSIADACRYHVATFVAAIGRYRPPDYGVCAWYIVYALVQIGPLATARRRACVSCRSHFRWSNAKISKLTIKGVSNKWLHLCKPGLCTLHRTRLGFCTAFEADNQRCMKRVTAPVQAVPGLCTLHWARLDFYTALPAPVSCQSSLCSQNLFRGERAHGNLIRTRFDHGRRAPVSHFSVLKF